jgi:hypothetical protein
VAPTAPDAPVPAATAAPTNARAATANALVPASATALVTAPAAASTTTNNDSLATLFARCYVLGEWRPKQNKIKGITLWEMHQVLKHVGGGEYCYANLTSKVDVGRKLHPWLKTDYAEQIMSGDVKKVNIEGSVKYNGIRPILFIWVG